MTVPAEFIAEWNKPDPRRERIRTDWIIARCYAVMAACNQSVTKAGVAGAEQVIEQLFSAANVRRSRAGVLLQARLHQICGRRGEALTELVLAASRRRTEIART